MRGADDSSKASGPVARTQIEATMGAEMGITRRAPDVVQRVYQVQYKALVIDSSRTDIIITVQTTTTPPIVQTPRSYHRHHNAYDTSPIQGLDCQLPDGKLDGAHCSRIGLSTY